MVSEIVRDEKVKILEGLIKIQNITEQSDALYMARLESRFHTLIGQFRSAQKVLRESNTAAVKKLVANFESRIIHRLSSGNSDYI